MDEKIIDYWASVSNRVCALSNPQDQWDSYSLSVTLETSETVGEGGKVEIDRIWAASVMIFNPGYGDSPYTDEEYCAIKSDLVSALQEIEAWIERHNGLQGENRA